MPKEKIMVFTKNWLGDVVFESPAIKAIKENFPDSELVCVAPKRCHPILENYPYVDRVMLFDEKGKERSLGSKKKRVDEWKHEKFTRAYLFHRSFTRAALTAWAGIPYRAGYNTKGRGFLLTNSVSISSDDLHDADYYMHLLKELGLKCELGTPYEFHYSNADEIRVLRLLHKMNIEKNKFLVFHTGGNWEPKRWPMESFYNLMKLIQAKGPLPILLTGTNEDAERIGALIRRGLDLDTPILSLAGETLIGELGALFSFAKAVVSNDSGPLHMACGVGAKTVALFGPTNEVKTGPRGRGQSIVIKKNEIQNIQPEDVLKALEELNVFEKQEVVLSS